MALEGLSSPNEYLQPKHVHEEVVRDIAEWIAAQHKAAPVPAKTAVKPSH